MNKIIKNKVDFGYKVVENYEDRVEGIFLMFFIYKARFCSHHHYQTQKVPQGANKLSKK